MGFAMGCHVGLTAAGPSFIAMTKASHSAGLSIPNYIMCQSVSW